eukprot:1483079-Prymnesium_polylepis.1
MLDRPSALIALLRCVCGVPWRRDEKGLVLELHLGAHLDALVGDVRVGVRYRRVLAERAVLQLLAPLVPLVLQLRIDVAGLGRCDHQPRLILHQVQPRRIRASRPLEDEEANEHAEVRPVPVARRQLRVPCDITERPELARLDKTTDLCERDVLPRRVGGRRCAVAHIAEQQRDLLAALAVDLPARLHPRRHERLAVGHTPQEETPQRGVRLSCPERYARPTSRYPHAALRAAASRPRRGRRPSPASRALYSQRTTCACPRCRDASH